MRQFAIWTEHVKAGSENSFDTMISSEIQEIKSGIWLISCGSEITHWRLHSIYDSFEEAYTAHKNLLYQEEQ